MYLERTLALLLQSFPYNGKVKRFHECFNSGRKKEGSYKYDAMLVCGTVFLLRFLAILHYPFEMTISGIFLLF